MAISVLVVDDQEMVRRGLVRILDNEPEIQVVGEAADGFEALALARELRPDVALVDIRMPGLDGIELTRLLAGTDAADPVHVVVITTFDDDEYVYSALRNGASGFLLKRSGPVLIVEAVRAAVAGDTLISPQVTTRLLQHVTGTRTASGQTAAVPAAARALVEPLTPREIEVVLEVARGRTNAAIAAELFITPGTVKTHVANIQRKLGMSNRVGIAVRAYELGLTADSSDR